MKQGNRVKWVGDQNPWCAPGYNGTVVSVSDQDPDQIAVSWDERDPDVVGGHYRGWGIITRERRKNLGVTGENGTEQTETDGHPSGDNPQTPVAATQERV